MRWSGDGALVKLGRVALVMMSDPEEAYFQQYQWLSLIGDESSFS